MALRILYFAWVREKVGAAEEQIEPPADAATVGALVAWLASRSDGHRAAFADLARIRVAVDQAFADFDAAIVGAREIAFFPPVTGG